jgi:hypothetical protein
MAAPEAPPAPEPEEAPSTPVARHPSGPATSFADAQ